MTTEVAETFLDKSIWPPGPWQDEPDRIEWIDEQTAYACLILRHANFGSWCGYVGVPKGHPLHGMGYDEAAEAGDLRVHGGLTFAGVDESTRPDNQSIRHRVEDGEVGPLWWFGFDCAHYLDFVPGLVGFFGDIYRDVAYVRAEATALALGLKAAVRANGEPT